jgi:DNA primase catalytic core
MEIKNNLSDVFKQLDSHFIEYITSHGRTPDSAGFINCLNPNHPDKHPSMHIIDSGEHNGTGAWCFSCLSHFDILHACNVLEGKPISGVGFFEDTLVHLCKMYNIIYEPAHISNEVRDLFQRKSATRDAAGVIHSMSFKKTILQTDHAGIKHLLDRGITEKSIRKFKIGVINSHKEYLDEMSKLGWDNQNWLGEVGLVNKTLFTPQGVIIPIHDAKGNPVGFVTRTTSMKPNDKGQSKYVNSQASNLYIKGEILFNYDNYKESSGPLIIVEGYLDAVYLTQEGIPNVVALGSTVLTEKHVDMLARESIKNIILCLDGDEGGRAGTKLALERLSGYKTFKSIKIVDLPEGEDPDTLVRGQGKERFKEYVADAFSPFAWTLKYTNFQDDPLMVVESAIPSIVAEESHITRLRMIRELSRLTGVAELDIKKDVEEQVSAGNAQLAEELKDVSQYVQQALQRRRLKDTKSILEEGVHKIKNLEKKYNNTLDNSSDFDEKISGLREKIEGGKYNYGLLAPNFSYYERMFDGIPYTTCLTLVGGRPSAGKTTWMTSLGVDIIEANDDAAVFYMSIDDTSELMMLKMLAQKTGFSTSKIKRYASLSPEERDIIIDGWRWLEKLKERFILIDATAGNTPETMEAHVEWFIKTFPDSKRIFLLDNFHKLRQPPSAKQKADVIAGLSEKVKELTQIYDLHIMQTVELRKMGESADKPSTSDLKDSVQLEYDADVIVLAHNELQVKPDTPVMWEGMDPDEGTKPFPFLELRVWKNKITGKTDDCTYKLDKYNLRVSEVPACNVAKLRVKNAGSLKMQSGKAY